MKPEFVTDKLWDVIPEDRKEALLLECGRRFRRGLSREAAFIEACDKVLADEVWAFLGLDDHVDPVSWPLLVERDLERRHPTFLRALELYGLAKTSPEVVLKLRDEPEDVFYLSEQRADADDCPNCGMILDGKGEVQLPDEVVHELCAEDFAQVRHGVAQRMIDYCRNQVPEELWDGVQEAEEEDEVEIDPLPEFLGVFDDEEAEPEPENQPAP
jgi:hypothetical protein